MHVRLVLLAGVVGVISLGGRANGGTVQIQAVAIKGDTVPGIPGVAFTGFGLTQINPATRGPAINNSGQIAFAATYLDSFRSGVWIGTAANLSLAADGRQTNIPGLPPASRLGYPLSRVFIDDNGDTLFGAEPLPPSTHGIWTSHGGLLHDVAVAGRPASGSPSVVFNQIGYAYTSDGDVLLGSFSYGLGGHSAFIATTNSSLGPSLWSGRAGDIRPVAYSGMQIPSMPTGTIFNYVEPSGDAWRRQPVINRMGALAFTAEYIDPGGGFHYGLFRGSPDDASLIARPNDPIPGTPSGWRFGGLSNHPSINDVGQIALETDISLGPGSYADSAIWSQGLGGSHVVSYSGMQAPGLPAGVVFGDGLPFNGIGLREPVINGNGQTSFYSELSGPGIQYGNSYSLWAERGDGSLIMLAREGMQVPGLPAGSTYDYLGEDLQAGGDESSMPTMNSSGQVLFRSDVTGLGSGLFLADIESGDVTILALAGQEIEIRPGVLARLYPTAVAETGSGGQDGRRLSLNDAGQVAFTAEYSLVVGGYGSGVFIASVPEPASVLLLAFGAAAVIMGRRRRTPCNRTSHRNPIA